MRQTIRQFFSRFSSGTPGPPVPVLAVVDTDAAPRLPAGYRFSPKDHHGMGKVTLRKRDGKLYVNDREVIAYLTPGQQKGQQEGNLVGGLGLYKELKSLPGRNLNACVGNYLFDHPELMPDGVRGLAFWGTIASSEEGVRCVLCLVPNHRNQDGWEEVWRGFDLSALNYDERYGGFLAAEGSGEAVFGGRPWRPDMPAARLARINRAKSVPPTMALPQ